MSRDNLFCYKAGSQKFKYPIPFHNTFLPRIKRPLQTEFPDSRRDSIASTCHGLDWLTTLCIVKGVQWWLNPQFCFSNTVQDAARGERVHCLKTSVAGYIRVELSQAAAQAYCARVCELGVSMQEVWIVRVGKLVADQVRWMDGCWSDRKEMQRGGERRCYRGYVLFDFERVGGQSIVVKE